MKTYLSVESNKSIESESSGEEEEEILSAKKTQNTELLITDLNISEV